MSAHRKLDILDYLAIAVFIAGVIGAIWAQTLRHP
jgi:predicted membrane channel-forming protein YqfA (hemolysin III family)